MTTLALFSVLSIYDAPSDEEHEEHNSENKTTFPLESLKVSKSRWADCEEETEGFHVVAKKTKKKGSGTQKNTCIGKLIFVHASGKWGKVERQDTGERLYTQDVCSIPQGSRVKFVRGENYKGTCANSLELI